MAAIDGVEACDSEVWSDRGDSFDAAAGVEFDPAVVFVGSAGAPHPNMKHVEAENRAIAFEVPSSRRRARDDFIDLSAHMFVFGKGDG